MKLQRRERRQDKLLTCHMLSVLCSSGSHSEAILHPRGHWATWAGVGWRMLLASHWQRPGILLNILHGTRQLLATENYPTQNVSSARIERLCSTTILRRRPISSCACKVNFLVKLSFHRQSSHCLPQKCPGWVGQRPWHPKEKQMQALDPSWPWEAMEGTHLMRRQL